MLVEAPASVTDVKAPVMPLAVVVWIRLTLAAAAALADAGTPPLMPETTSAPLMLALAAVMIGCAVPAATDSVLPAAWVKAVPTERVALASICVVAPLAVL